MEFFIFGFIVGLISSLGLVYYLGTISLKKKENVKKSINDRIKKVQELTKLQHQLMNGVYSPQKNSLDGKYRAGLVKEIKSMEEEKTEILKSILKDGYDPVISSANEGGVVTERKLSHYLTEMGIDVDQLLKQEQTPPPQEEEQKPKFTVLQGGKTDDDDETFH